MGMIQIRNVPDELHRKLKARAASEGMSLSDYMLRMMKNIAAVPTIEEVRERLARLPPVRLSESVADAVRDERERR